MALTFRPARLLVLSLTCATLLVSPGAASAAGCANETLVPDASNTVQIRAATRCLLNQERSRAGRRPLVVSGSLTVPAQVYAQQMVTDRFFDHISGPDGSLMSRVKHLSNYIGKRTTRYSVGENLAWGSYELGTPVEIVKSWMASPGHRNNILDPRYRDVGIGVASGAPEDVGDAPAGTYSTVFGQRTKR